MYEISCTSGEEKNEKIRVLEQDFRQLLEDETKQVEEIS